MGWQPVGFGEIEPFPSAVLAHHYPDVPNLGDMTKFKEWPDESIDLLVGGTPCQSFSVAGLRRGMADPRGNLALTYLGIADRYKPRWIVWENVPGVLSSNGGRDFGSFLGALAQLGYGFSYRVLDAQFFGVAQRRRRVFVVGYLGDWRPAAAVLFERDSLSGNPAPRREKRQDVAGGAASSVAGSNEPVAARMVAFGEYVDDGTASAMKARDYKDATDLVAQPMAFSAKDYGADAVEGISPTLRAGNSNAGNQNSGNWMAIAQPSTFNSDGTARTLTARYDSSPCVDRRPDVVGTLRTRRPGEGGVQGDFDHIVPVISPALNTQSGSHHAPDTKAYVAFTQNIRGEVRYINGDGQLAGALAAQSGMNQTNYVATSCVRRLTPVECERLQGFPDNFTAIPWRKKDADQCPDGPRYKALGNSMAVPVMRWIGERIQSVNELSDINKSKRAA
jgi:DNA (cytosine-5)-methyltransferase 1